ncbi:MAG TPA: hypothetical protein VD794_08695 [Flavisolibacter sp.]|nr:hypothetical protein [Flavisolibacter sp.]
MRRLLLASLLVVILYSCCKGFCEPEQGLHISIRNLQAVDTDTVYLIRYKANTGFSERIDTVKRIEPVPAGNTLPSSFMDELHYATDWKVVIPAVNKEYFISNLETKTERCSCTGDKYRSVIKFRLNNMEKEGSSAVLD